jgi:hypothetical protein
MLGHSFNSLFRREKDESILQSTPRCGTDLKDAGLRLRARARRGNPKEPGDAVWRSQKSFLFCMSYRVPWNAFAALKKTGVDVVVWYLNSSRIFNEGIFISCFLCKK